MNRTDQSPRWPVRLAGCLLVVAFPAAIYGQAQMEAQANESAQQALKTYTTRFIKPDNVSKFGFKSVDEAGGARLGAPLPVLLLTLSDLKAYKTGATARQMAKDAKALWYPVLVGNEVRAKLEMVQKDSRWVPGEFGGAKTAAHLGTVTRDLTQKLSALNLGSVQRQSLVRVPALNVAFLLLETASGEHMIAATTGMQKLGLEPGRVYPAAEVLTHLSDFAQKVDDKKLM